MHRDKTLLALVICLIVPFLSVTADSPLAADPSGDIATSKELLRQAGALPDDLDKLEEDMMELSPTDIARFAEYLRQQSASALGEFLENRRYEYKYTFGPDSQPHQGVPKGELLEFTLDDSKIFPGTTRKVSVYVPFQYRADKPACVYVGLDGLIFRAPTVFDNLIHKREVPVTIAIGITAGEASSTAKPENPRFNRSFEFDSLHDKLAQFLLEEVFPEVERHKTSAGLPIRLSNNPNDRAAGGISTGGIGSFTLAWTRPDAFRRVFTASGTFVGMRGGDRYPVLVRKTEPKPIRVFMQDGSRDGMDGTLGEVGDWWMSNQAMQRALQFSGYDVLHAWGEGGHGSKQGAVVFPDAMRWLWKDWPQPIKPGESQNVFLKDILRSGQTWEAVPGSYQSAGVVASDADGTITIWDAMNSKAWKLSGNGKSGGYSNISRPYAGLTFGPNGRAYVTDIATDSIVAYDTDGRPSTIANNIRGASLVVSHRGNIYVTESGMGDNTGKLWLITADGTRSQLASGLHYPTAIALSPDGLWLAVAESKTHWGYSYRVEPDGTVQNGQRFYWFHTPDDANSTATTSWVMDKDGRLYAGTRTGVQVLDRNGRVRAILPVPGGAVTGIAFGGDAFDSLFVSAADNKLYRRRLKVLGARPSVEPTKLPPSNGA